MDLWTEYLGRWLSFRGWLYRQYGVPASFELHSQAWLAVEPAKHTEAADQLALVQDEGGELIDVLRRGRVHRKTRFEIFEKGSQLAAQARAARPRSRSTTNCSASLRTSSPEKAATGHSSLTAHMTAAGICAQLTVRCYSSIVGSSRTRGCGAPLTASSYRWPTAAHTQPFRVFRTRPAWMRSSDANTRPRCPG
jgi:hypothetical protein